MLMFTVCSMDWMYTELKFDTSWDKRFKFPPVWPQFFMQPNQPPTQGVPRVKWLECEAGYSTPSGVEVKNDGNHTSTPTMCLQCEQKNYFVLNPHFQKAEKGTRLENKVKSIFIQHHALCHISLYPTISYAWVRTTLIYNNRNYTVPFMAL